MLFLSLMCAVATSAQAEGEVFEYRDAEAAITRALSDKVSARLGLSALDDDYQRESFGLTLETQGALLDWRPFRNGFHVSGGFFRDTTSVLYTGGETDVEISGFSDPGDWQQASSYLGMGWGNALDSQRRLGMMVDVGVMVEGMSPDRIGMDDEGVYLRSPHFNNDREDLGEEPSYRLLPVVSVGLSYQF